MKDGVVSTLPPRAFATGEPNSNLAGDGPPVPVPPSKSVIRLPADQYLHLDAPTEWWWHIGTLKAGDRVFGFEINAASFKLFGFTQVMLTDVSNGSHFQQTTPFFPFDPNAWAEHDPSKDWAVKLGEVSMHAPQSDPTRNMSLKAGLTDEATGTKVTFDLRLSQEGPPFIVWGTGVHPTPPPAPDLQHNNFYYSLTRLKASGSISVGDEKFDVTGVTWMDHEYGLFGTQEQRPKWILQDMQLDNGVCISNYSVDAPELDNKTASQATVQRADGTTYFVSSFVTPTGPTWTSPSSGLTYFMQLEVEIPAFEATLIVRSMVDSQEFYTKGGSVYEGVASASGTFEGETVSGTAWNEQRIT
ncbi:MAG TPA: lipocalin-like domain-containing protein [Pyrinomonadaceae bacterium]|nr:lipocalin-like domain-containing protein [Pyrinomonadaceae bacterium]